MSESHKADNAAILKAWNAWKQVCWVDGLGVVLDGRPAIGTKEDADILRKEIRNAFMRKLSPFRLQLEDESEKDGLEDLDCARIFDESMVEYEHCEDPGHERYARGHYGEAAHVRKAKAWKDFVWQAVANSDDPELKVIRGKLTGPHGVINQVVEDWLMREYPCWEVNDRATGKNVLMFAASYDEVCVEKPSDDIGFSDDGDALDNDGDGGKLDEFDFGVDANVLAEWSSQLEKVFADGVGCCVLLAASLNIPIYNDSEVLEALGIGKSAANAALNRMKANASIILSELDPELRDWMLHDTKGTRFWMNWLKNRASAEKAGELILSRVNG